MASGDTLLIFHPYHNEPPSSSPATPDLRNQIPVLDFDAGADEAAIFSGVMPRNYAGGGITIYIHYLATSATSGNAIWQTELERNHEAGDDLDSDSFATGNKCSADAVDGTSGKVCVVSIAHTSGAQMDSLAAGEAFRLRLKRLGSSDANDTVSGDLELMKIEIKET